MSIMFLNANALHIPLADGSVQCVVTSPPYYGLRDYGIGGQIGLEDTPEAYVANLAAVFREVRRVLRDDGTVWLNLGDSYATGTTAGRQDGTLHLGSGTEASRKIARIGTPEGLKTKDLIGIPWRVAFALQADGWYLRSDIIWAKPNPMPESVTDRPTKAHEYIFLLSKSARYYYDNDAVREPIADSTANDGRLFREGYETGRPERGFPGGASHGSGLLMPNPAGRNRRTVWSIATAPYSGAHFATYPPALVEPCIKAGTSERGCCQECGAPWERVVNHTNAVLELSETAKIKRAMGLATQTRGKQVSPARSETIGWQPTCECMVPAPDGSRVLCIPDPVPCIVLDPFSGSGTTAMVARKLGRHAVGLDLSLTYIRDCARPRLQLDVLDGWTTGKKVDSNVSDLPMFSVRKEDT